MTATPTIRTATLDDGDAIDALMKVATRDLFPAFYDAAQTASSVKYIASVDRLLLTDGTYLVLEADGELVACGGWSRRDKLYTGSGDAADDLGSSTRRPNRRACARCSSGQTGRGVA